jgi:predicted transcriptional regulator
LAKELLKLLSRRERQIMDIIYKNHFALALTVQKELPDNPNYSTVRTHLCILERKGYLYHKKEGNKYIYYPVVPRENALKGAFRNLLSVYFNNSVEKAVNTLISMEESNLTDDELRRIADIIEKARKEDKKDE